MRTQTVWIVQDDFKVGDKVIYSVNSKNLKDIFNNEKFSLKHICKVLSMSLPNLKKHLNKPELFKEKQLDKLGELLSLSKKELNNYFSSKVGSKIKGFRGLKVGEEFTISGVSEDGTKVSIKEDVSNKSSTKTTTYYNYWRFEGVKIKVVYRNFLGAGGYRIKNEIRENNKKEGIRREKEREREQEIQKLKINKNNIPKDRFNIQKMYDWDGWVSFIKEFVLITGSLLSVSFLLYLFWNDFDSLYVYQKFSILKFLKSLLVVGFPLVIYPVGLYRNLIQQLIIYRCINNMSKYKCTGSKHIGIIEKQKNIKYYQQNFKITKNGFHRYIGFKHGVDIKNNHILDFLLIDELGSSYYGSKSPSFEETVIVYLDYLERYNYTGEQYGKFYHERED